MTATDFNDYPLADRDRQWDGGDAESRVREWSGMEGTNPNDKYRDAHFWYDGDKPENVGSYKLLFCDVMDGEIYALPRGIMAAAAVMEGSRGGVDLPHDDIPSVRNHIEKYYGKMNDSPPW